MALLSPFTGSLSDRINPAILASSGMVLITIGLALLSVNVSFPSFWLIALALIIIGIGFALFTAPNNNAIMGSVTPKYYGAASSVVSTVRLIGQVLSVAIITLMPKIQTIFWPRQHRISSMAIFSMSTAASWPISANSPGQCAAVLGEVGTSWAFFSSISCQSLSAAGCHFSA